jgi:hypothetical protein
LLLVALVGIGALVFSNYDALRASASDFIEEVVVATAPQQTTPTAQTASGAETRATELPIDQAEPEPPGAAAAEDDAETNAVAAAEPSSPADAQLPLETVERNPVVGVQEATAPVPPSVPESAEESSRPSASSRGSGFRFAQQVVTIREGQVAAAVLIERAEAGAPATVVWWTSDSTAVADEDYADLGQRTERFRAGEQSRTIYVPLVADALPERTESFYVYLGRYDASRSHLEPLSQIRVDIRDDD